MTTLSAQDAFDIGKALLDDHDEVHAYFTSNWSKLSPKKRERLQSLAVTLYQNASDVITHGVGVAIDDLKVTAAGLVSVTKQVQTALTKLKKIDDFEKVAQVAIALISFAASIPTGNVPGILSAIKSLMSAVEISDGQA